MDKIKLTEDEIVDRIVTKLERLQPLPNPIIFTITAILFFILGVFVNPGLSVKEGIQNHYGTIYDVKIIKDFK